MGPAARVLVLGAGGGNCSSILEMSGGGGRGSGAIRFSTAPIPPTGVLRNEGETGGGNRCNHSCWRVFQSNGMDCVQRRWRSDAVPA